MSLGKRKRPAPESLAAAMLGDNDGRRRQTMQIGSLSHDHLSRRDAVAVTRRPEISDQSIEDEDEQIEGLL
jgi:hypothetical protein